MRVTENAENILSLRLCVQPLLLPPRDHPDPTRLRDSPWRQRIVDDLRLLLLMAFARPGRGTRALRPADVSQLSRSRIEQRLDLLADEAPRSHVPRLLLRPDHLRARSISCQ